MWLCTEGRHLTYTTKGTITAHINNGRASHADANFLLIKLGAGLCLRANEDEDILRFRSLIVMCHHMRRYVRQKSLNA